MAPQVDEQPPPAPPVDVAYEAPPDVSPPKKTKTKKKRDATTLRKAPQAPKRFKSSYICFFMAKQPEIKGELGLKASVTEVSKRSAEMWRNLPADERAHWDDVAAKDKQRYMIEKANYTGPWQVPWKRAKKDPSAPKRPMSAFLYFSQDKRRQIKDENPSIRNTEVSRILGELWRNASDEEKSPHVVKERGERAKYKIAIAEWRKEYEKKMEEQRKQQAEQATYMSTMYQGGEQARDPQSSHPQQYPPQYADAHGYNPYNMHPGSAAPYSYPPQQPYPPQMYPTQYPPAQGQYGYANGKHVAILGQSGMPHYPPAYPHSMPQQQPGPPPSAYEGHQAPPQGPYDHPGAPPQVGEEQHHHPSPV
mmetsp:Transcript_957/g.1566  ORF Transcript_957/g.1566 Transcript_957/m.1566 type:complete len:363 (-) Transcript_957:216-1304(-)|eukprot:CAMPEP_0119010932 /NCGR_PEP_ID=MMETSP1176-20130426/5347_1 /TAXON_ID=265551 /ORGANISM="Synedropsis recta cf, Strain CCMP1620" /LENGTH=362 /DNA_ID=CAMNT_0006963681 /DNA_START=2581 /DNA_END=3669 /DNA_ORIENTATION=+